MFSSVWNWKLFKCKCLESLVYPRKTEFLRFYLDFTVNILILYCELVSVMLTVSFDSDRLCTGVVPVAVALASHSLLFDHFLRFSLFKVFSDDFCPFTFASQCHHQICIFASFYFCYLFSFLQRINTWLLAIFRALCSHFVHEGREYVYHSR